MRWHTQSTARKNTANQYFTVKDVFQNHLEVQWLRFLPSNAGGVGSITGQELRHASQPRKEKQKQYRNKFNKGFKNGPHQKKLLKNEEEKKTFPDKEELPYNKSRKEFFKLKGCYY